MGRHSRKGRGNRTGTDKGAAPDQSAEPASGPGAAGPSRTADGRPGPGAPWLPEGTTAPGISRLAGASQPGPWPDDRTPARGMPRFTGGTPAAGEPRGDGAPARGGPRPTEGTPAHGVPRPSGGTAGQGPPQVRGGHPQQREPGGGWGEFRAGAAPQAAPPGRRAPRIPHQRTQNGGPRQEYLDAFDGDEEVLAPRRGVPAPRPGGLGGRPAADAGGASATGTGAPARRTGGKGLTFTGIAAAAVTTVLAVVVAGQVADGQNDTTATESGQAHGLYDPPALDDTRPTPSEPADPTPLTYEQAMGEKAPLSPTLTGSGKFAVIPGAAEAPGTGRKYTYRVDMEEGLGLDGELFAQAVQKTLNDDRSWAHDGARTFERVSSGRPDFVITLASPGTTAAWCAKSGLDTTEDNVSCDSASTERVMINAYRWAQGSKTYGNKIHPYRQMLINHEVGHRLGYGHVSCDKDGQLAPVMQQQTKFLDHDGIHCRPNPWPYPHG
ncbi:DUF3152 domain-containing protein [Streptomyces nodosus]|uniref:DUF3152 domain-containing protein n=1 Tax=Streptomyces nodosus TaxID=40318 RepID=UPI0037F6C401